ncbi:hypothetical protein GQ53DRAFT_767975 [Thozetella sp. PMI_491]|nr:hypothetical protein GQ53DRAFT_767975 [Thozetella sp. PMI_491]
MALHLEARSGYPARALRLSPWEWDASQTRLFGPISGMVCHATNCDLDNPGDPDVAGIGVVVSFGVTALLNLGVIIYLYFSGHLRGNRYRPVDLSLLNALGANPLKDTDDTSDAEKFEQKQLRIEMYERFIISMSDQQLVTGIAILVALYIKSCSVSVFSFEIAVSVAYFSCSIHISTLTVLRQYLKRYKKLAILRSIMMVILAIMLLAGLLMIESGTFYQVPSMKLGCALADFNSYISHNLTWVQVGNTAMICWFIISAYGCFLYELFDDRFIEVLGNWYFWLALSVGMSNDDKDKQCKKIFEFRETKIIERIGLPGVSKVRMVIIVIPYLLEEFSRSFLYKILWMLFYFTFGVATFCELWVQHGYYKQVLDVWGFGQLVPMFLLALPLLSAYEVYEEAAERRKPKDLHQTCSVATSGPTATMHGNDEIKPTVSVEATNHGCTGPQGPEVSIRCSPPYLFPKY